MSKVIWKFDLPMRDVVTVPMPRGASVLHVNAQHDNPMLWALCDPTAEMTEREFRFTGTGHPIEDRHIGTYIGTFQMRGGQLVFHVFETKESVKRNAPSPLT